MSENQVPTQEEESQSAAPSPTTVKIGDEEIPVEQLQSWREAYEQKDRLMADYTRKTQAVAETKRALEAEKAKLLSQVENPAAAAKAADGGNFDSLNEYVPGLGGALANVMGKLNRIEEAHAKLQSENAAAMQAVEAEEAMDKALGAFQGKPLANPAEMRKFLEDRGLGPEHADLAYDTLYGFKLGQQAQEEALKRRNAGAKPPMRGGNLGIPGSTAREVPAAPAKSLAKTSWQELRNQAKADPRKPTA